jgi:hypothetical protein
VKRIDPEEWRNTEEELGEIVSEWRHRSSGLTTYWNDYQFRKSLMIGAERAAAKNLRRVPGNPWPTPNSMRSVEPGTPFRLTEALQRTGDGAQ